MLMSMLNTHIYNANENGFSSQSLGSAPVPARVQLLITGNPRRRALEGPTKLWMG